MELNNGTKLGLGVGVILGIVLVFSLGIESLESQGSTVFFSVVGGAVIGTIVGFIFRQ